ncbi:sulfurtransferase complex subunit TusC [Buchnera aphidicola]|uniref:sulfurtransferase complex subunit TusC n=1 Tax=Buchnera aphidicola TaxID=9 RepID=UPI003464675F
MKKIAVIFSNSPYGTSFGLEGINFVLSASCYTNNIFLFFIGDGIFQILENQDSSSIFFKSYSDSFSFLEFSNIKNFYLCYESLIKRGLNSSVKFLVNVIICNPTDFRNQIDKCDVILNF